MIDYTILVPRCQAFYSKIFLYFPSSQFFLFNFSKRRLPTQTQKRASRSLHTSNTAAQRASLPLASRSAGRQQTPLAVLAARRVSFTPRPTAGLPAAARSADRRSAKCRPQVREVPTAGPRNADRSLHTSNTAAQRASRSLKSRSAGRQQTPRAVLAARGVLFHTEADGGLARRCAKCRPQVREVPTAGPRSASRLSLVI